MTGPGRRVRALAARWCSAKTMERVVDPALADLQTEYADAQARGQALRSYWIWIASLVGLAKAITMHGSARAIEMMSNVTPEERGSVVRTAAWSIVTIVAVTVVLAAEPLRQTFARSGDDAAMLAVLLVPQALPIAIPVGMVVAILQSVRHGVLTSASRALILGLALVLSLGSFAALEWVIPETNQRYRERIFRQLVADDSRLAGQSLARGPSELSLSELHRAMADSRSDVPPAFNSRRHPVPNLAFIYHSRWAIVFAPLVLALFAVVVATRLRRGRALRALLACVVVVGYWEIYFIADRGLDLDRTLPMLTGWAPNIGLLIVTAAIAKLAQPRAPATAA